MKKMKLFLRVAAAITAMVLVVCLFTACGKDDTKDEQGRTIISIGDWPSKEGKDLDNANAKKARFEEANPDVVIEPDMWTFDRKTFYAKAAGGQLPLLYKAGFTEVPEIISSEYSADIAEVLKKRGYDGMINEDILEVITDENGKIKAFPTGCYLLGLGYNTELFKTAGLMEADGTPKQPKNWNEVVEFAVKIKETTGKPGFIFPSANGSGGWLFTCLAWSYGVDFMEKDADGKWQATFNTSEAAEALQLIKDLKWKYEVLPANTIIDNTEYYKTYGTGGAGMLITDGSVSTKVLQYGMKPEQLGIMAMPAGPKRHVTLLGGNVWCIRDGATEEQIDAAVRWLETSYSFNLTEEFKKNTLNSLNKSLADGRHVGIKSMSIWNETSEALIWDRQQYQEAANANLNHVRLYNDFVVDCPAEIQPEEPVCCQELYGILDGCIQEVLTNKDADCKMLLEKANTDFQKNYLDNLNY